MKRLLTVCSDITQKFKIPVTPARVCQYHTRTVLSLPLAMNGHAREYSAEEEKVLTQTIALSELGVSLQTVKKFVSGQYGEYNEARDIIKTRVKAVETMLRYIKSEIIKG